LPMSVVQYASRGIRQSLIHPLVDGLRAPARRLGDHSMVVRRGAESQLAGIGALWLDPVLGAKGEVILDRAVKRGLQLVDRSARKMDHVADSFDCAVEQSVVGIQRDRGAVAFVRFHGVMPASSRNRRR